MKIVLFPNKILRQTCQPVNKITPQIKKLVADMFVMMKKNKGVGLSAPQIGQPIRLVIAKLGKQKIALINPKITKFSKNIVENEEGCLSFPDLYALLDRPESIKIKALNLAGKPILIKAKGFFGTILQHEIDHLSGKLFIDQMKPGTIRYLAPEQTEINQKQALKKGKQELEKLLAKAIPNNE